MSTETQEFMKSVEDLIKSGKAKNIAAACRELGENPSRYYSLEKHQSKKTKAKKTKPVKSTKRKVQVIDLPQAFTPSLPSKLIMVVGTPTEILIFAKGLVS